MNTRTSWDINDIKTKSGRWWTEQGQMYALHTFHEAAKRVPAYKDFLETHKINPQKVSTFTDLQKVPYTDKKNYLDKYSLKELIWDGDLHKNFIINSSSGTTGQPYFWPCNNDELMEGALIHEFLYETYFKVKDKTTLIVVCFGMGTWVAGIYTFMSSYFAGEKNSPVSIMTPGFNKEESLRILKELSPDFDQVIIAGYPTFVKDLLEHWTGKKHRNIKFLFAAEGFTESWRDYVMEMVGNKNITTNAINILGSADASIMGFETPLSIKIRRSMNGNKVANNTVFKEEMVPSLENYIPTHRFFEEENNELILTANRPIPLIRYNIHDKGGVYSSDDLLLRSGVIQDESEYAHNLPFVYVYGRGKFTATIYAANIYPENIREVLVDKKIRNKVTGKFTLETKHRDNHDHYLNINVELAENVQPSSEVAKVIAEIFVHKVTKLNSEYHKIYQEYRSKAKPEVSLFTYGDPALFPNDKLKKIS